MTTRIPFLGALAALLLAAPALAADLQKLPQPITMPQTGDSPGVVKFDHSTHVDAAKPSCAACHPGSFSILGRSAERKAEPVTHKAMEKGESCGACHGKQAFNFEDCTMCHAQ